MREIFNKIFLLITILCTLILINSNNDNNVKDGYSGPFGLNFNYIGFNISDKELQKTVYNEIEDIQAIKNILSFDDNSNILLAKLDYEIVNKNMIITDGFEIGSLEYKRAKKVSYCKNGYDSKGNEKLFGSCIAHYYNKVNSYFESFDILSNISGVGKLNTITYIDFYNSEGKKELLNILNNYDIKVLDAAKQDISHYFTNISSVFDFRNKSAVDIIYIMSFIGFSILGLFVTALQMVKHRNEFELLKKIGVSNKKIIKKFAKRELIACSITCIISLLIYYLTFGNYSISIEQIIFSTLCTLMVCLFFIIFNILCIWLILRRFDYEKTKN
ncbi:MAG: hypothetical protein ACK5KQ_04465 [Anaerorhabdus sp.]